MLEKILKMYVMAMATGVTSPLPHLFGPPGCGKSTVVEMAAEMIGVNVHVINVSRLSPLELEGVQMPHTPLDEEMLLKLLPATFWTQLKEGDILLLDEFLRGFPEVYNGLLDILTGRKVGGFKLPKVFIIGASNSTVSYDKALEDRLLHIPVTDPRGTRGKTEKMRLGKMIIDKLGLLPEMAVSMELHNLMDNEVLPMFDVLDALKNKSSAPTSNKGSSIRNLIGQAQLREVQSPYLAELLSMNNSRALNSGKLQYVFVVDGKAAAALPPTYVRNAAALRGNSRVTALQKQNIELNLQLIEMEKIRFEKEGTNDDDGLDVDDDLFG